VRHRFLIRPVFAVALAPGLACGLSCALWSASCLSVMLSMLPPLAPALAYLCILTTPMVAGRSPIAQAVLLALFATPSSVMPSARALNGLVLLRLSSKLNLASRTSLMCVSLPFGCRLPTSRWGSLILTDTMLVAAFLIGRPLRPASCVSCGSAVLPQTMAAERLLMRLSSWCRPFLVPLEAGTPISLTGCAVLCGALPSPVVVALLVGLRL
jgi:hypothetical protein